MKNLTLLLLLAIPRLAAADSWTVNTPDSQYSDSYSLPHSDAILKWCADNKVRYSKDPVPGYRLCGEIEAEKLCDPSGKRFISGSSKNAPYAYKDCSIGPRITVIREEPLEPSQGFEPVTPMTEEERLAAHEKIAEIKQNEAGELAKELMGLSTDLTAAVREMRKAMGAKVD